MRRQLIVLLAIFAHMLVGALQAKESERPNIVFIFADDWGWGDVFTGTRM